MSKAANRPAGKSEKPAAGWADRREEWIEPGRFRAAEKKERKNDTETETLPMNHSSTRNCPKSGLETLDQYEFM